MQNNPVPVSYNKPTGYALSALQLGLGAFLSWKTSHRSAGSILLGSGLRSVFYTFNEKEEKIDPKTYLRHSAAGAVGGFCSNIKILSEAGYLVKTSANFVMGLLGKMAVKSIQEGQVLEKSKILNEAVIGVAGPSGELVADIIGAVCFSNVHLGFEGKEALIAVVEAIGNSGASKLAENWCSGMPIGKELMNSMTTAGFITGIINSGVLGLRFLANSPFTKEWAELDNLNKDYVNKLQWFDDNINGNERATMMLMIADYPNHPEIAADWLVRSGIKREIAERGVKYWQDIKASVEVSNQLFRKLNPFKTLIESSLPILSIDKLRHLIDKPALSKDMIIDPNSPAFIHHVSIDILSQIFSYLPSNDIKICQRVCKPWNELLNHERFREMCGIPESFQRLATAERLLAEIPSYKFFKRFYRLNLVGATTFHILTHKEFWICAPIISIDLFISYVVCEAVNRQIRELSNAKPEIKLIMMEAYNNSPVIFRVGKGEWAYRERRSDEKYTDVDQFVKWSQIKSVSMEILFVSLLNISTAFLGVTLWQYTTDTYNHIKTALIDSIRQKLRANQALSFDAAMQQYLDPTTGRVMLLPVETSTGEVFDLLSILNPSNGEFIHPISLRTIQRSEIKFRADLFNTIHNHLAQQNTRGNLLYHSHPVVIENRTIDPDYDPRILEITGENSLENINKILLILNKVDRTKRSNRELIATLESKVNAFIRTQTREVFYNLIQSMQHAKVSSLHFPFVVNNDDLERIRQLPLQTLTIGVDITDDDIREGKTSTFTSQSLSYLQNMPLHTLVLQNCSHLTTLGPLAQINTLKKLTLSWCTGLRGLVHLVNLRLEELTIIGIDADDSIIPMLSRMPLKKLTLKRTKISQAGIQSLRRDGLEILVK